ncbi:hypothetical protein HJFPF1_00032 [Paramyrothecium foliicola]|nr:hypothetical protein HJFPF1_00032 [Paramyrothecium foliicola]
MHPSFVLTVLAAAVASGAAMDEVHLNAARDNTILKRGCYSGGENWGANLGYALSFATQACNDALQGDYNQGDQRSKCYNLDSNKKVDFRLSKHSDGSRHIAPEECYDGMQKEINNCDHGGETSYGNWFYKADPNAGQCAPGT